MRWLLLMWHRWCIKSDLQEMWWRTQDGTASDAWTVNTMQQINWRESRIQELSAS